VRVPGLFSNAKAPTLPLGALVSIQNADTSAASHVETPTRRLSAVTAALATVTSESQSRVSDRVGPPAPGLYVLTCDRPSSDTMSSNSLSMRLVYLSSVFFSRFGSDQ
jgi:hypothetical protein